MILACEPQCAGFEHAEFNAATLAVLSYAYPQERIVFAGEKHHLNAVRSRLRQHGVNGIEFYVLPIPKPRTSSLSRMASQLALARTIFRLASARKARRIVFCSVTSHGLVAAKMLALVAHRVSCLVVPHGILESVRFRPATLRQRLLGFKKALAIADFGRMRYLVLGASIEKELLMLLPGLRGKTICIDLPYLYEPDHGPPTLDSRPIVFGSFGTAARSKGTDLLLKLAADTASLYQSSDARFVVIGPIVDKDLCFDGIDNVDLPGRNQALDRTTFAQCASQVHYSVFFQSPDFYRLTASASLFDAFSFARPIIALRNPFMEQYFDRFGKIGYLCESYDDIRCRVLAICRDFPSDEYLEQRSQILESRQQLRPQALALALSDLWQ